jgi:hypothetical protein
MASKSDLTSTDSTKRRSVSETGHAKNVANFQNLIAFVAGYGTAYNPTKSTLKLPELNAVHENARANLSVVMAKNTAFNNTVNDRVVSFKAIKPLATRMISALEATDASSEKIKDAKGFVRKLHGRRTPADLQPLLGPEEAAPRTISTSQQSYDLQVQHFAGLVSVLASESSYSPNEADLKLVKLNARHADLQDKNNTVSLAYTGVSNARIIRDKTLYNINTGLVEVAGEVKKYVKSVFGAASPEFAQVKGIEFRKIPQ